MEPYSKINYIENIIDFNWSLLREICSRALKT